MILYLTHGNGEESIPLELPAASSQVEEIDIRLDDICSGEGNFRILDVKSSVKGLWQFIRSADLLDPEDLEKLNRLSRQIDTMSEKEHQIFAGALLSECISNLNDVLQTVERIGTELRNTQNDETSALSKLNKAADAVNQVIADDLNKASERAANPSSAVVAVPSNAGQAASVPAAPAKAPAAATAAQATVQPVAPQVKEGSSGVFSGILLNRLLNTFSDLGTVASVLLLAYFLLAAGDQFRRKTVSIIGDTLKQKRITVEVLNEIHRSVQKYLGSMFLTNLILGLITYVVLFLFGFENARVWGLLAGILHIIPYLGTLLTAAGVFVTGLQQWSDLSMASMAAGTVFLVASVIGTFAQTWILGKIVNINHTAQFVALLFFGWLWGAVGLLIAMPLLVVIKVIVSRIDGLDAVAHFLKD